ncbi:hypothetical protein IYO47_003308 [Salmonella enterica]|nr:hypothetical protein [Salmonella enterica]
MSIIDEYISQHYSERLSLDVTEEDSEDGKRGLTGISRHIRPPAKNAGALTGIPARLNKIVLLHSRSFVHRLRPVRGNNGQTKDRNG